MQKKGIRKKIVIYSVLERVGATFQVGSRAYGVLQNGGTLTLCANTHLPFSLFKKKPCLGDGADEAHDGPAEHEMGVRLA